MLCEQAKQATTIPKIRSQDVINDSFIAEPCPKKAALKAPEHSLGKLIILNGHLLGRNSLRLWGNLDDSLELE